MPFTQKQCYCRIFFRARLRNTHELLYFCHGQGLNKFNEGPHHSSLPLCFHTCHPDLLVVGCISSLPETNLKLNKHSTKHCADAPLCINVKGGCFPFLLRNYNLYKVGPVIGINNENVDIHIALNEIIIINVRHLRAQLRSPSMLKTLQMLLYFDSSNNLK